MGRIWDRIVNATQDAVNYRERLITNKEADQARKVFRETLPYGAIWISNGLGFDQRPYTIPHPTRLGSYVIHFGPDGFANALGDPTVAGIRPTEVTFIHELAHVWQGHNSRFPPWYVFDSVWHQASQGGSAYAYTPGQNWSSYNCEQQAKIVGDWWNPRIGGANPRDPRFPYVRDNIRGLQR
jgi:hypothetical protein